MARRNDHSREEIRAMALDAARTIIAAEGYKGLSARRIARAIGYTVGTLYLVFENLDDVVLQLNGATLDEMYETLAAADRQSDSARDALRVMGHAYIEFAQANANRWQLIFDYIAEQTLPDWYDAKIARMFALVEARCAQLPGAHSRTDAALSARALWCGVHGICSLMVIRKLDVAGIDSVSVVTDSLIDNYLTGLSAAPGKEGAGNV